MKNMPKITCFLALAMACVLLPCGLASAEYALYIEQSPVQGGAVTPGTGSVHSFSAGESVTLTATPAQGYEFVYWLGAVSDPSSATTNIGIDGPRYVVAVFERSQFDSPEGEVTSYAGNGGGGSGLRGSPNRVSSGPAISGASGVRTQKVYVPVLVDDPDDEIPIPDPDDPGDEIPVPDPDDPEVPEPATMLMLGSGMVGLALKRKRR